MSLTTYLLLLTSRLSSSIFFIMFSGNDKVMFKAKLTYIINIKLYVLVSDVVL